MLFRFPFKTSFGHLQDVVARCLACLNKTSLRHLIDVFLPTGQQLSVLIYVNDLKNASNSKSFKLATQPNISLDGENIKTLIKGAFEEEFKKQEVNIAKIINSNFVLIMKEIKSIKQEVNDLRESI